MIVKLPVSEEELADALMPEIDRLSLQRRVKVWETWPEFVDSAGTWECLRELHIILFGGLFSFAGKLRTCNIAKGGFRFANVLFLREIVPIIAGMPQSDFGEIIDKYTEMNIAHPFREGNGRVMRLWLDAMLERETGTRVDWRKIARDDYVSAMQRSLVNTTELAVLLKGNMLPAEALGDEEVFMSELNASYKYEM